jgi:SAM-dependent methyltransferase
MQLESIACPLCSGASLEKEFGARDFRYNGARVFAVARCRSCGFKFLNPRPKEDSIEEFYRDDFYSAPDSPAQKIWAPLFSLIRKAFIRRLKRYKPGGRLLDIGCGSGELLSLAFSQGYDVYGVEPCPQAKNHFFTDINHKISNKTLRECAFTGAYFDIVLLYQSLEHVHELDTTLKEISRVTKPGGFLFISVPNSDFFEARLFGRYYYNLEVPRHLYFFNRASLNALLNKYGWEKAASIDNPLLELFCTPASLFYAIKYILTEKGFWGNKTLGQLSYLPLILLRAVYRLIFIFDRQNLNIIYRQKCVS